MQTIFGMWTEKPPKDVSDRGCKRYAVCGPYIRTHRQNSQLNTLARLLEILMSFLLCNGKISGLYYH